MIADAKAAFVLETIGKPVLMDVPLPPQGPPVTDRFDPQTLWWRHEWLHRAAVLGNFAAFVDEIRLERDELEADFRVRINIRRGVEKNERSGENADTGGEPAS